MGTHPLATSLEADTRHQTPDTRMSSVKIVDILKACKQSRVDQALGLKTAGNRFGGAVKSSNMTPPWGTAAPPSTFSSSSLGSSGEVTWNSSNAARYEEGTTFYSQVSQAK